MTMIIECILISSSLCNAVAAKPKHTDVLPKKEHAIVAMLKDRPVMALAALDLTAKAMDYRQTEQDFRMGGFQEHNAVLRPMLGHPAAMTAYGAAYAMGSQDAHVTLHGGAQALVAAANLQHRAKRLWICLYPHALPPLNREPAPRKHHRKIATATDDKFLSVWNVK